MKFEKGQIALILSCDAATENKWLDPINKACDKFGINTRLRLAAFIAQVGHESGRLKDVTENLNYSASGLLSTWPNRFDTFLANSVARNPEKIANIVYCNRMGNGDQTSGDGWKYRGRGLIQCTGKANYDSFSQACGVNAVGNPDSLALPDNAALSAGWFWASKGLNGYADRGDLLAITKRINGGTNGQADRELLYKRALIVLDGGIPPSDAVLSKKSLEVSPDSSSSLSDGKTPSARNSSIVEPRSLMGDTSQYPWNLVFESRSGHVSEMDDTPGNERVSVAHRTGSYWEMNNLGTFTTKSILDSYKLTKEDAYDYTGGNYTQQVKGQSYRQSTGDMVFKTEGQVHINAGRVQMNTGVLAVSGEIDAPSVNANIFGGMGGMAFGDLLAKESLVAYDLKKGKAPMLGQSLGFKGAGSSSGSADGLMSNDLSNKAPDGTPWTTNGVKIATTAIVAGAAALAVADLLKGSDVDKTVSNAIKSAANDTNTAADGYQTPVFLKHVSFDKPTLLSQSTTIDTPDASLYVNNYHTIVDSNGVGVLHISDGKNWIPVGSAAASNSYTDSQVKSVSDKLDAEIIDRANAIANEAQARADDITNEAQARQQAISDGLLQEAQDRQAAVTAEATTRQTADDSLSDRIVTLTASVNDNAAAIQTEQQARADAITAEANERTTLAAKVDNNTSSIVTEQNTRASEDSALSTRIDSLTSTTNDNIATINTKLQTLTDTDTATSSRIDSLSTKVDDNSAAITSEQTTRSTADSALSDRVDAVLAKANDNAAAIVSEQTTRANADSALSDRVDAVLAKANDNAAAIVTEQQSRADGDSANATQINSVSAKADNAQTTANNAQTAANNAQTAANNAQTAADAANSEISNITSDNVLSKGEKSAVVIDYNVIINEQSGIDSQANTFGVSRTTYDNAVSALTTYLTGLTPAYNDTTTNTTIVGSTFRQKFNDVYTARQNLLNAISAQAKAIADAKATTFKQSTQPTAKAVNDIWIDTANNNRIKVWDGTNWVDVTDTRITQNSADIVSEQQARANGDSANASDISNLSTTVNGHTSSINTNTSSINGIKAQWGVRITNNGTVAGVGLISDMMNGTATSQFIVEADKFSVVKPGTSTGFAPFSVDTTTATPTIYLNGNVKINGQLSSFGNSLGTFKSAQTGARTEISDSLIQIYDSNNVLRVKLGVW